MQSARALPGRLQSVRAGLLRITHRDGAVPQAGCADSSFNTELVKISRSSLESVIEELYGKQIVNDFRQGFDGMESQLEGNDVNVARTFSDTIIAFVVETFKKLAFEFIRSRIGF
jgi:hypothetical protein